MQFKNLILLSLLLVCSISSYSQQQHGKDPQQRAQAMADQLAERIMIPSEKKDSLVMAFKTYFQDMHAYRDKGEKMTQALETSRDSDVRKILVIDSQYQEYQKFMSELAAQRQQHKNGHSGHHRSHE